VLGSNSHHLTVRDHLAPRAFIHRRRIVDFRLSQGMQRISFGVKACSYPEKKGRTCGSICMAAKPDLHHVFHCYTTLARRLRKIVRARAQKVERHELQPITARMNPLAHVTPTSRTQRPPHYFSLSQLSVQLLPALHGPCILLSEPTKYRVSRLQGRLP
jgi:hypothetical protein